MYEVVNGLLGVFSAMFQGCCLQYFFGSFLEGRIRRHHAGLWTVFLYAVLKLGMDLILPSDYGSVRIFAKLALTLCILTILVVCCYRAAGKIKVFLVVAFLATGEFSFFLAYNVCWLGSNLYSVWMWCLEKGYIASLDVFDGLLLATTLGISATMHIVSIVILSVSLKSIVRSFREKDYAIRQMEFGSYGAGCPFAVFPVHSVRSKAFSGHDLLEQGKKQPDYFGETGQQPAGAYGEGRWSAFIPGYVG